MHRIYCHSLIKLISRNHFTSIKKYLPSFQIFNLVSMNNCRCVASCDNDANVGFDGVFIYRDNDIANEYNLSVSIYDWSGIDNLFLDLSSADFSIYIGCIYCPHHSPSDALLLNHLATIPQTKSNVLITSDFNYRDILWSDGTLPAQNSAVSLFLDALDQSGLFYLITEPTIFGTGQAPSTSCQNSEIYQVASWPFGSSKQSTTVQSRNPSLELDSSNQEQCLIDNRKLRNVEINEIKNT
ncbi:hypothetical protein HHI36_012924, partial [Cryptolaemus montrouzieri]